ncbi:hypothetical protein GCM10023185_31050 [Hymenobacter saemangeumensis]|uniref:Major tail protein n=1 Tax=Hymenobacter saemangeumensis TaxID=1084522 RepID=A0ABP8IM79_9BACT
MADTCNKLSKNVVSRACAVSGGIKNRVWVFHTSDFTGAKTYATNGSLSGFTLVADAEGIKATGRARKGNTTNKLSKNEEGAVNVEQAVALEFRYNTEAEKNAIMEFLRADNKTVFVETNAGTIRQHFAEFGDDTFEGEDGSGTAIGDASNILKVTLKGNEQDLPIFFEAPVGTSGLTQLAASKAYLDALCVADVI